MKPKLKLVIFSSSLHDNTSVINSRKDLFDGIRRFAELEIVYPSMLTAGRTAFENLIDGGRSSGVSLSGPHAGKTLCFIATGGTEEIFRNYIDVLPRPVLLLSDGLHNSLAASFEIKTYLARQGIAATLFNAPLDGDDAFFGQLEAALCGTVPAEAPAPAEALPRFPKQMEKALEKTRIGLIGGASDWLIASDIDREAVEQRYGVRFEDISLQELETGFAAVSAEDEEVRAVCARTEGFLTGGRTREDLAEAARMYIALRKLCEAHGLQAFTLKCFGILNSCRTTACLALALLNDEGIVAGCEGDIPSLWTMLYVKYLYGQTAFMANPSSSNRKECTLDFAHCTIPLTMVHGYRLPTHFESQSGIGIAGSVPSGRYRIVKISGRQLDAFYETEGDLIMNTNIPQRCRTQIRFRFSDEREFDRFLQVNKGNHIILYKAAGPAVPSH